ncbi:BglG family transcription antiterminator [Listeria ivanovii]|uniref:Putative transcription antiterminator BglG family n=1 Tax=Listeria ivanovii (strain ATCC BAA-678 / PAM 55) TaxID=881621 RepID=G2ZCH7_LISIP|nr:PTS sugar transporter subunit IIA [Listeria ivanovii]AHI55154.1 transcription antiterminator BglG [Listeria ivanovii WSLC3009]AIS64614.1 PTS fructose transporter subunit IIA [Listeria ivanovii subsp. ivanovii]MCJ1716624.1 PTS sugar transporter subunit IIA [Listeria ivanovii]MCJ1721468.1 PTS sugar transporter subunit IIA [Listeria ivanovii]MCJ1734515.1 PTS sugar transporter subunit IIA [Listeria ivanovii]
MLSGRMVLIIKYLEGKSESNIRDISRKLEISERKIRYDIDNINDALTLNQLQPITKEGKGRLVLSADLAKLVLEENEAYIYTPQERINILQYLLFFNIKKVNLEHLSKWMKVSRTTIKKDLLLVEESLQKANLQLVYKQGYHLNGNESAVLNERVRILRDYIDLIPNEDTETNFYKKCMLNEMKTSLINIDLNGVNEWSKQLLKQMGWILNDESYYWYLANILVFCWYIKNDVVNPLNDTKLVLPIFNSQLVQGMEAILDSKLTQEQLNILVGFVFFTNKYASLNEEMDLITTETLVNSLINKMSGELNLPFLEDAILYKGLLNHVAPLIERIRGNVQIYEDTFDVIPAEFLYVFRATSTAIKTIPLLESVENENEISLLSIHFLASIQRNQREEKQNALIVCGLGYGAIAMMKDALNSEYQIGFIATIPEYMLKDFTSWEAVDLVITTAKMTTPLPKPTIKVSPVLKECDFVALEKQGLKKKNILTSYFAINKRLSFLESSVKQQVISVIKEELGYGHVSIPNRKLGLSDLIGTDAIQIVSKMDSWREAIQQATSLLADNHFVQPAYADNMIEIQEELGFYSVKDKEFALFHGNDSSLVQMNSMALLVSKNPIIFGNKQASVIFILASKDKKEQIPAIITLTKMTYQTDFISKLEQATNPIEANQIIKKYEEEVKEYGDEN